jgi:hypothetical protein
MRTTLDLNEDAYQVAKTVAREQNRSLGSVVSDFILARPAVAERAAGKSKAAFPEFRCTRRVTSEDVKALDEEF